MAWPEKWGTGRDPGGPGGARVQPRKWAVCSRPRDASVARSRWMACAGVGLPQASLRGLTLSSRGHGPFLSTLHVGGEAVGAGAPPGEPLGPHLLRQRLCTQAAASQAPSGCPSPIFLVSINSGKIFKYTKA